MYMYNVLLGSGLGIECREVMTSVLLNKGTMHAQM